MADYGFYRAMYHGTSISEAEFPGVASRAEAQLSRYRRIYTVEAPTDTAEDMAICAMADAIFYFDSALSGGMATSISVGSVSCSRPQGALPDLSPRGQAAELYRCAQQYLTIRRGQGTC